MRILLIQDFGPLAVQTAALLKTMVVSVDAVDSIERASDALAANRYDLAIWDVDAIADDAGPQSIETYVHRLRRKAEHPAIAIETLRGLGYRLTMMGQQ